jgi:transposase-like protein
LSREGLARLWVSRVNDYRASGEPVAVWCERHQVTPKQLWYWQRKFKKAEQQQPPAAEPKWIALSVETTVSGEAPPIMVKVGTVAVEVRAGFDSSVFAAVVRTLKTLC